LCGRPAVRALSRPRRQHRHQPRTRFRGQSQGLELGPEADQIALPAQVAVHPRCGGRVHQVRRPRVDGLELGHDLGPLLQPVFLVIVLRQVEPLEGRDLGIDRAAAPGLLGIARLLGQAPLFLVVKKMMDAYWLDQGREVGLWDVQKTRSSSSYEITAGS
jgi:hypothetical protein